MSNELRAKLHRLGVKKGSAHLKSAGPVTPPGVRQPAQFPDVAGGGAQRIEQVMPGGSLVENDGGGCYVVDRVYPLSHRHGRRRFGELLGHSSQMVAHLGGDRRLADLSLKRLLFLDTETTGLGGAGTFAFMIGAGFFRDGALVIRQFFCRDQADEGAMLRALADLLLQHPGLVTFNGRSFDLPLLENRLFLNQIELTQGDIRNQPHLDLLPPARRVWRWQWSSCSLGSLETNVLEVSRTQADVPGALIPWLYSQYLRSGDAAPLGRVFYHNHVDMLSMVTLATEIISVFDRPDRPLRPLERLGLARWHGDLGAIDVAERHLRTGLQQAADRERERLLRELTRVLKRTDRRSDALTFWQELAQEFHDLEAHIELAKYFEWGERDFDQAIFWTEKCLNLAETERSQRRQLPDLRHRLNRLNRKRSRRK